MRGTVPIQHLSRNLPGDHALFEDPDVEAPHVGCASTSGDLYRFAEMLRRGGELDGVRILSPATLELARQVHTGDMPNQLYKRVAENAGWEVPPANQGIGFQVRGTGVFHHLFGTLASPETHGNYGAGSTMFWVDPGARRQLRAVQRRGDDPGRQYRALPEAQRPRAVGDDLSE